MRPLGICVTIAESWFCFVVGLLVLVFVSRATASGLVRFQVLGLPVLIPWWAVAAAFDALR